MNNKKLVWCGWIFSFALLFISYFELILIDPILPYDDIDLLQPLWEITNILDYLRLRASSMIIDVQPVRDISFLIDMYLKNTLPWYSFHLTNFLLWIGSLFLAFKIMSRFSKNDFLLLILVSLIAFSTYNTTSIAWISARKHILSCFFILLATHLSFSQGSWKKVIGILATYSLAIFSQPINILWIFWFALFNKDDFKKRSYQIICLGALLIFALCFYLNKSHYASTYLAHSASLVFNTELNLEMLSLVLLSLGRYFFQTIIPFFPNPMVHDPGSIFNLIGLFLLVIYISLFKFIKIKQDRFLFFMFLMFYFLPLVITQNIVHRMFNNDTYLLTASLGFYLSLIILLKNQKLRFVPYALAAYALVIAVMNINYVRVFKDYDDLVVYSFTREATSMNAGAAVSVYVHRKDFAMAEAALASLKALEPNSYALPGLAAKRIFYNPEIGLNEKVVALNAITPKTPAIYLYLTALYQKQDQAELSEKSLALIFFNPALFVYDFSYNTAKVFAYTEAMCEKAKTSQCTLVIANAKEKIRFSKFNLQEYETLRNEYVNGREIDF